MPPPLAAEPTMSGDEGSGSNGLCDPPPPAPPRRPRSRTGLARAAGESAMHPGGEGCASAAWGEGGEELLRVDGAGRRRGGRRRRAGAVPPVDDAARGGAAARTRDRQRRVGSGRSRAVDHGDGRRVAAPAAPRSQTPRWRVAAHRSTSSSRPSSSPRAERWPARRGTPRSSSTPRSRCRVTPGALAAPGEALAPAALALSPEALAAGARAAAGRGGHASRRARAGWPTRSRPGRCAPSPETLATTVRSRRRRRRSPPRPSRLPRDARRRRSASRAGRGPRARGRSGRRAGVAAASWEAVAAGAEAPPSVDAAVPGAAAWPPPRPRRRSCWSGSPRRRLRGCRPAPRR